jgi:multidrug efflux system outer membrane protein
MPVVTSRASSQIGRAQVPGETEHRVNQERYDLGLDMAWEIDLFGRIQRELEASERRPASGRGQSVSAAGDHDRRTGGRLRSTARRATAGKHCPGQPEKPAGIAQVTMQLRDEGVGNELDVVRADARLAAVEASIPQLQAEQVRERNRIATLLGERPDAMTVSLAPAKTCRRFQGAANR